MHNRASRAKNDISNDWLDDDHAQEPSSPTVEIQKQSPKSPKNTIVEKTQRIKKPKKQERKIISKEEVQVAANNQSLQERLLHEAVVNLRNKTSGEGGAPIYKKLTRERLLDFLEIIEEEYSLVTRKYLTERRGLDSSGNLKQFFKRFIDSIVAAFPALNDIVFKYQLQYYDSGPLHSRFSRLMGKSITPILKFMSEQYFQHHKQQLCSIKEDLDSSTTHLSHSPEREHLEEFELQDAKKSEKRRRKKNKKKENQQGESQPEESNRQQKKQQKKQQKVEAKSKTEVDRSVSELTYFLDNLSIDKQCRLQCRIDEWHIGGWKQQASKFTKNKTS